MKLPEVSRRAVIILGVFLTCMLAVSCYEAFLDGGGEEAAQLSQAQSQPTEELTAPSEIIVYVSGAVARPGIIKLSEGARVYEAVEACGGILPTADAAGINMAAPLKDGAQINVVERLSGAPTAVQSGQGGQSGQGKGAAAASSGSGGLININTADEQTLMKITGVGPKTAAAIIEYRQREGSFQAPEDLKKVNGIGDKKFERISSQITI